VLLRQHVDMGKAYRLNKSQCSIQLQPLDIGSPLYVAQSFKGKMMDDWWWLMLLLFMTIALFDD